MGANIYIGIRKYLVFTKYRRNVEKKINFSSDMTSSYAVNVLYIICMPFFKGSGVGLKVQEAHT